MQSQSKKESSSILDNYEYSDYGRDRYYQDKPKNTRVPSKSPGRSGL